MFDHRESQTITNSKKLLKNEAIAMQRELSPSSKKPAVACGLPRGTLRAHNGPKRSPQKTHVALTRLRQEQQSKVKECTDRSQRRRIRSDLKVSKPRRVL